MPANSEVVVSHHITQHNSDMPDMAGYVQQREWKPTVRRGPISAEFHSPGPASVTLPSYFGTPPPVGSKGSAGPSAQHFDSKKTNAPSFSMGARIVEKSKTIGPGPVYDVSNMSPVGGKCNVPVAKLPPKDREDHVVKKFNTPGPSAYDVVKADKQVYKHNPAWQFKDEVAPQISHKENVPTIQKGRAFNEVPHAPGPVYDMPSLIGSKNGVFESNKASSPSFSLSPRPREPKPATVPGPGTYKTVETEAYKHRAPQFSLSSRTTLPTDKTKVPGPGNYSPEKAVLDTPPRFSFGIKHSPYLGNFKEI